jgi:hypothetical protein
MNVIELYVPDLKKNKISSLHDSADFANILQTKWHGHIRKHVKHRALFSRLSFGRNIRKGNISQIIELFIPTNAPKQFFHCFLYYYNAPIRISAVIPPSSGGILSEFFT